MKLDTILRKKRVAIYGRHSTDKQEMDAQIASAEKLVKDYECTVVARYFDKGISATKKPHDKRPQLARLMHDVVDDKFDVVITYNRDRLARNPLEHQKIRVLMQQFEIPIVLSSSETLYDTGDLISQLAFDGLTKFEVDQTRVRTRDTLRNFVRNGRWTGGKSPYGYVYHEKKAIFTQDARCIETITRIFNLYKRGEGFKNIAEILNRENADKRTWTNFDVKSIITNPFYAGYVTFGKGMTRSHSSIASRELWLMTKCDAIPPMIDDETWEACWRIYWEKRQGVKSPTDLTTPFLLKDVIFCESCRVPLIATNQVSRHKGEEYGSRWYRCPGFKTCHTRIDVDEAHDSVFYALFNFVLSKTDVFDAVSRQLKLDEGALEKRIQALQRSIEDNEREALNAQAMMKRMTRDGASTEARNIVLAQIQKYRLDLEERNRTIRAEIEACKAKLQHLQIVQLRPELWEEVRDDVALPGRTMNDASLRRLALYLLDGVWVNPDGTIANIRSKVDLT